jgi:hypothetical protein
MDPVTAVVIAVVAALAAGFGAGWGLKPDASVKALEAQTEAIEALQEGQSKMLENASKPIVIDAELKATLAEVPVQCRKDMGGDPTSVQCQWATCLQFGQSSAQRPECRAVETLMVDTLKAQAPATP